MRTLKSYFLNRSDMHTNTKKILRCSQNLLGEPALSKFVCKKKLFLLACQRTIPPEFFFFYYEYRFIYLYNYIYDVFKV